MIENKRYNLHTDLVNNCFIVGDDCKFGMFDKLERKQCLRVIDLLNEQEEIIQTQKEYIVCMGHGTIFKKMKELEEENEQLKQKIQNMKIRFKRKYDYEFDEIVDELD